MNARMPELKRCFEAAGFLEVKTLLSSGNVAFTLPAKPLPEIERTAEAAMREGLGHSFLTIVRSSDALGRLLEADPFAPFQLPAGAKRVVTFLRFAQAPAPPLPIERDGARILAATPGEVFSAYLPSPRGPVFMGLIEKTFGKDLTTRTWETVGKCARA